MKKYADKTSAERSIERWENEGGDVLPTALRNKEIAKIEMQENKSDKRQHIRKVIDNSFEGKNPQSNSG